MKKAEWAKETGLGCTGTYLCFYQIIRYLAWIHDHFKNKTQLGFKTKMYIHEDHVLALVQIVFKTA